MEALEDVCEPMRALLADPDSPCRVILGLEPEANLDQVVVSLARTLKESESKDPRFVAAKTEYDRLCEQALERDVVTVVGAGNSGEFARVLLSHGLADPGFYHNVLSNPHTLVVGALEPSGRPADYATPQAGAQIGANGVSTRHKEAGSSFAAPRVAEAIALMTVGLPGLSAVAARDLLLKQGRAGAGPPVSSGGQEGHFTADRGGGAQAAKFAGEGSWLA